MKAEFRTETIKTNLENCSEELKNASESIIDILRTFKYGGETKASNSTQLDIYFDSALFDYFDSKGWNCKRNPIINSNVLGGHSGAEKADAIFQSKESDYAIVLEIEKANKKTLWFDFIKLWMYIETGQAHAGIIIVPLNYAHRHGVWNLFDEAVRCKYFLKRFANIPEEKLRLVGIIGYEQQIFRDGQYRNWNSDEFNLLKERAKSANKAK